MPSYKTGEIVRLCQLKCDEALYKEKVDTEGIATKMADDQKELLAKLRPLITATKGERGLWPLVDSIAIRTCHRLLEGGIEIFCLPGMSAFSVTVSLLNLR